MKQAKLNRILTLLRSAQKTGLITRLSHDPADSSVIFFVDGKMHEMQWDDKESEYELVAYQDRKTFERLGFYNADQLEELFYGKPFKLYT
jgi:hypothetical protein